MSAVNGRVSPYKGAATRAWGARASSATLMVVHEPVRRKMGVAAARAAHRTFMGRPVAAPCAAVTTMPGASAIRAVAVRNEDPKYEKKTFRDANFPTDDEGRTYHLGTKPGEVSNRILSVGDHGRAARLAGLLDPLPRTGEVFVHKSSRGFVTYTGMYNGVPVSIVTTLMGMPNMDFVVRECRAVVQGQMAFLRLGTCGGIQEPASLGKIMISLDGSVLVRRDPDAWDPEFPTRDPYAISRPVPSNSYLGERLAANIRELGGDVATGLNASADSFYSSQGRSVSGMFNDRNEDLVDRLVAAGVHTLEMETFHLLDLARVSGGNVIASAMAIVLAERWTNDFLGPAELMEAEIVGGKAALTTLSECTLGGVTGDEYERVEHVWDP